MPNIKLYGYKENRANDLAKQIDKAVQDFELGKNVVREISLAKVVYCNGKNEPAPYLNIFSSTFIHIPIILASFQKHSIKEDVEIVSERMMFFDSKEIESGQWKNQFTPEELLNVLRKFVKTEDFCYFRHDFFGHPTTKN